jgi:putative transposase
LEHLLLLRLFKIKEKTTDSHHWLKKYPNLIKGLVVTAPGQLWMSDITYIPTLEGFCYLSMITDAYSRKIIGYCLYPILEAIGCIQALLMAIKGRLARPVYRLINHSDGGVQYCCFRYIDILAEHQIIISMAKSPYENAIAEKINDTIKNELGVPGMYKSYRSAKLDIPKIVAIYNQKRLHSSIDYLTPDQAHQKEGHIKRRWKSYWPAIQKMETNEKQ